MFTTVRPQAPAALTRACRHGAPRAGRDRTPSRVNQAPIITATAVSADQTESSASKAGSQPAFENNQRFYVPDDVKEQFEAAWAARHAYMETQPGFISFNISEVGDSYTVTSKWASIPEWEAFNLSKEARRHHLPYGIWQYVPKVGEGFPEDFVPFLDMNAMVQARYPKK